jgi:predicted nucleotidyltransferase component of viral defense system
MSETNYKQLYSLQTEVLQVIKTVLNPFYLTGGTALGRFYLNHRFSADLDFFTNNSQNFKEITNSFHHLIRTNFSVQKEGSLITDEFVRYLVAKENVLLKIEFVNDVAYRYKSPIQHSVCLIDNIRNIFSNKLTCIVGRDEPKDFYDIICIAEKYSFNWKELFGEACEKAFINEIELSKRIAEFPTEWLLNVDWLASKPNIENIKKLQEIISSDILLGVDNSLCRNGIQLEKAIIHFK